MSDIIDIDPTIEHDNAFEDGASAKSITGSVWGFEKENGRTYHGYRAGTYHWPNDPTEADRLDFQYSVQQHALDGRLHFAPLEAPATILDIGTGTGAWAIEIGELYPDADVVGTDLSPIQSTAIPNNVNFIIDDADQEDWAVPENHYDYIHTRILMGSFEDFGKIVRHGFTHIKPGGYMESQEVSSLPFCDDDTMTEEWRFNEWSRHLDDASVMCNRPLSTGKHLKQWYIDAGFVDVQEKIIKLPVNTWPKNKNLKMLGQLWNEHLNIGLDSFSLALFSRVLGWSQEQIEEYLVTVRRAAADRRVHAYHRYYIVWGRKPEDWEASATPASPIPAVEIPQSQSNNEKVSSAIEA